MKGILRRPLAVCCGLFLLALFWAQRNPQLPLLPITVLSILLSIIVFTAAKCTPPSFAALQKGLFYAGGLLLAAALAFSCAWRAADSHSRIASLLPKESSVVQAEITVTALESSSAYSTALIGTLHTADGQSISLQGRILLPYEATVQVGDRLSLPLQITPITPEGTLADCYALSQGLTFEAEGTDGSHRLLSRNHAPLSSFRENCRTAIGRQFYPYLNDEDSGLLNALLTGDRSGLSSDLQEQFDHLGISHTLAVSGLHLGILFGSLLWVFKKLSLPRIFHLPLLLPLLLAYGILVGSASVFRAGGMLLFLFAAYPLGRLRDPLTSLFATVTAICLLSPGSVLDIGLLLSFFATWGILLVTSVLQPKLVKLPRFVRAILSALAVTGAATLFTLPFSVWYFGEWALLSPLSNLILVPLITILLYLAPILLLLAPIPSLAATPALLIQGISAIIRHISAIFGTLDGTMLPLTYSAIQTLALILTPIVTVLCIFRKTRPLTLAAAVLFLSLSGAYCLWHAGDMQDETAIFPYADDAGENRCLLLQSGTRILLIDRSDGGYSFLTDAVEAVSYDPLLRIDTLLLTEYRYAQISSYTRLFEKISPKILLLPSPSEKDRGTAHILAERAAAAGCTVRYYAQSEPCIGYCGYEIQLLYSEEGVQNDISIQGEGVRIYCSADGKLTADSAPLRWNRAFPLPIA